MLQAAKVPAQIKKVEKIDAHPVVNASHIVVNKNFCFRGRQRIGPHEKTLLKRLVPYYSFLHKNIKDKSLCPRRIV